MAYRINAKFKNGTAGGPLTDIVAAEPPRYGDTIYMSRQGHDVAMLVTAIWTPMVNCARPVAGGLIVIEAREI